MANTVLLQVQNLTKSYGPRKIFDEANVSFGEKQKIGVIGPNGAGKTTFFKILMRQEMPDSGEILWMPNLRLGYIEQHDTFSSDETVIDFLQRYTGKPEWECAKIASQFQLKNEKLTGKVTDLSGGWQMRVKLTATLLFEPNLLLLDEPTNYLDLSTLMLLENFLLTFKGTVLVITHDREFIKKTCTSILDVEHGQLFLHHEPLEKYLEFKEEREALAASVNVNIERKQKQLQTFVDRFGANKTMASSAQSKLKQIAKLDKEKLEVVAKSATVRMYIPPIDTRDGVALECKNLTIGYDGANEKGFKAGKVEEKAENIENTKPKILFATTNNHKIRLFKLAWENQKLDEKFDLVTLNDLPKIKVEDIEENSGSFTGDALIRAKIYAKTYNLPTISQDRGFVFETLNWPGTESKKVMFGDDKKIYNKKNWEEERQDNLARAKQVLSKIDGKDRKMQIIQGLAIALPNGESIVEEKLNQGMASEKIVDKIGGSFDWFFVAQGQNRINSQFESQEELDQFSAINLYPITPKIVDFLENGLSQNLSNTVEKSQNSRSKAKIIASNINLDVNRGLKVAILGDNGQGKSTLLKTLAGELLPLGGVCEFKNGLKVAYYHQHVAANLDPHETVFDYIKRGGQKEEVIYRVLSNFLFKKTDYLKKIEVLSGGEKARLCLAGMFLSKADVYLLDEPTNHLDFETVEAMGRALGEFNGTVFVISHNRTFVSLIASEIWEVNAGQVKRVLGTYADYLWAKEEEIRMEMRFGNNSNNANKNEKYADNNSGFSPKNNTKFGHLSDKEKAKKLYETKKEAGKIEKKIKNIQELIAKNEAENNTEHAEKNQAILDDLEIQYLEILEDLDGLG